MTYQIVAGENLDNAIYKPRGGAMSLIYSHDPEVILWGPSESGKTLAACWKAHLLCLKYPGLNGALVRKTQKSIYGSVLQTWKRVIKDAPVDPYGGEKPEKYIYQNGSVIWVGGMDNPDKVLSSERDFIYVNQAEELALDDWEKITTRTTGRGAVMPYTQTFGDCNPGGSRHWIRERARDGRLVLLESRHTDNPTLYDESGALTAQGIRTMATLDALTGIRYKRLRLGQWATAEGAVYDMFDAATHIASRDRGEFQQFAMCQDEGYTNPSVILDIGIDADGRWHVFREFYRRGVLQNDIVKTALEWQEESGANIDAVDASAAGLIADLVNAGVCAVAAKGRVLDGISTIQNMLKISGDGKPRLTVDPSCVNLINEFESYVWKPEKDEPMKENDHALDALRYLADAMGVSASWYVIG